MKTKTVKIESKLMKWSKSRLDAYESFNRDRLTKGGKMPFSQAKLKATYMSLFSHRVISLSDIARQCGVKYGVLRVWRTEDRFKKQIIKNMDDYAEFFKNRFLANFDGSKNLKTLNADFYTYSMPLKMSIVSLLLSARVKDNNLEGTETMLSIVSEVNILLQQTIECLMSERPAKISVLEEIISLQNMQLFLMNNIRREFYNNIIEEMLLKKIWKHITKGQNELKRVIKAIRFVDSEVDKILKWRMGSNE